MSHINLNNLTKYYGDFAAIQNVSFSVAKGEITGLLGLNGAGKSTILKILGTFLLPSDGKASIAGSDVENDPHAVREKIGYLPDHLPLYEEMEVCDYLRFVARLKNVPAHEIEQRISATLDATSLKHVMFKQISQLSHGYKQRVGIAQAIVHKPEVIILDEPMNGLDPLQIVEMRDLILSFRGKFSVILSSHILSEIAKTCDKIILIDRGRVIAQGKEEDLLKNVSTQIKVECTLKNFDSAAESALTQIVGYVNHKTSGQKLIIDLSQDCREEVLGMLVQKRCQVSEFKKVGEDLENLFVQLLEGKGK